METSGEYQSKITAQSSFSAIWPSFQDTLSKSSRTLMTPRKSSISKYGPHFKILSGSSHTLMTPRKSSTSKYGPHFKTLSGSSRTLMIPCKSNTNKCGPHFKTLSESSCIPLALRKSSTYGCGLYLKTLSESSLEITPNVISFVITQSNIPFRHRTFIQSIVRYNI
ncbi:unnamed protein product [Absidia cylindrospora]